MRSGFVTPVMMSFFALVTLISLGAIYTTHSYKSSCYAMIQDREWEKIERSLLQYCVQLYQENKEQLMRHFHQGSMREIITFNEPWQLGRFGALHCHMEIERQENRVIITAVVQTKGNQRHPLSITTSF